MNEENELDPDILAAWRADLEENDSEIWGYEPLRPRGSAASAHFENYLKQVLDCPKCLLEGVNNQMYLVGEGENWSWECSRCGYHINGPDHYKDYSHAQEGLD